VNGSGADCEDWAAIVKIERRLARMRVGCLRTSSG